MTAPLRLGLSANLSDGGSVHRATFERAILLAREDLGEDPARNLDFYTANDFATGEGGAEAARTLVDARVELVIGHFASGAANAASAIYDQVGVPLLLPAASADALIDGRSTTFRICDRDCRVAELICDDVAETFAHARIAVLSDGSLHGLALSAALRGRLREDTQLHLTETWQRADVIVFVGLFRESAAFVREVRGNRGEQAILLTDDAVHADLAGALRGHTDGVFVYGAEPPTWCPSARDVRSRYRARWGTEPGAFFLETYAAMQIAHALAERRAMSPDLCALLEREPWDTTLGLLRFAGREAGRGRIALYSLSADTLVAERRVPPVRL